MKKALTVSIQFIIILLLASCSTFDNKLKGDPITVSWVLNDGYHDEEVFRDYCPFEYNDIYYKEIPNANGRNDPHVKQLELWQVDTAKMKIWGKMRVRKSDSAYFPEELSFLYSFSQAFAYFEDCEDPLFVYCFNHLWCRKEIELSAPKECVAVGYELLEVDSGDTLSPRTRYRGTIEESCRVMDIVNYRTRLERRLEYDFHQHYYKLRFVDPEHPFLYAEMEVIKLETGIWCWVYDIAFDPEIDNDNYGRCMITEMSESWQKILNQYEK